MPWTLSSTTDVLADSEGTPLPYPAEPIKFHTFPDPRLPTGTHFRFIVSSCATPNFPYAPLQGRRIRGFDLLADYLWPTKGEVPSEILPNDNSSSPVTDTAVPAEFMLFLGDFIYADVPMYFGDDAETYRRFYRRNYQSDSLRKVYERLREYPITRVLPATYSDLQLCSIRTTIMRLVYLSVRALPAADSIHRLSTTMSVKGMTRRLRLRTLRMHSDYTMPTQTMTRRNQASTIMTSAMETSRSSSWTPGGTALILPKATRLRGRC